jgi:hypothetical protein
MAEDDSTTARWPGHPGAEAVAEVFKFIAVLVLVFGIVGSIVVAVEVHKNGSQGGAVAGIIIGGIAGSIVSAAALGFFAYVLDILMAISWNTYLATVEDEDEE